MDEKIFTIIIPAYNSKQFLERALSSLISNKKFIYEVIIIDDCSEYTYDNLIEPFKNFFEIKIYRNDKNYGAGVSRRIGIIKTRSEWLTFIDSDDCITPNCLRYVYPLIKKNTILLHSQTIYYESGHFNKDHIKFSDLSCGGNFYKKDFLINHNILPSLELRRVEDEYFNNKLLMYLNINNLTDNIERLSYPVYEVHHDFLDTDLSLALSDKEDYFCCSRLKSIEICIKDFWDDIDKNYLETYYLNNLYQIYLYCYGINFNELNFLKNKSVINSFISSINFYMSFFKRDKEYIIDYAKSLTNQNDFLNAAINSVGGFLYTPNSFEKFIEELEI